MNDETSADKLPIQRTNRYDWKAILTILFGLYIIWTGLLRSIEAVAYKPNALWFCMCTGLLAIAGGFLYRIRSPRVALIVSLIAAGTVLSFYLFCFITQPEKDANYRVGLVIVAAIAELVVIAFPKSRPDQNHH